MLSGDDLENFGYYEMFQDSDEVDWADLYSAWVEKKILTSGSDRLVENTLGLVGEAGEVAEKIKKIIRDSNQITKDLTNLHNEEIMKELGDVVFYATALANIYGRGLQEVLELNIQKLDDRQKRGKLKGSGDNR
jgi:NTP pyrophosphatase (non-canonical NTP hydrolase)